MTNLSRLILAGMMVIAAGAAHAQSAAAPTATPAVSVPVGAPIAATPAPDATLSLPAGLSVSSMFNDADVVVKGVMVGLIFASVVTWTILLAKGIEILLVRRRTERELRAAEPARILSELRLRSTGTGALATMVAAAATEMSQSEGAVADGIVDRVHSRLHRIEAALSRRMARGTGFLATIGATAPFVGLFGTVWGIMNSFIGIARLHTTNLAVVAPGIAEALLATATGLVAAIPAVVIYNVFARGIGGYRATLGDLSAVVQRVVSRDLDLRHVPHAEIRPLLSEAAE